MKYLGVWGWIPVVMLCLWLTSAPARAEVTVKQATDRSVDIGTSIYTAHIDSQGNLTDLSVKGAKSFGHRFGTKLTGTPAIEVAANKVTIRAAALQVVWTFEDNIVHVQSQGMKFELFMDPTVKAATVHGGKGGPAGGAYANTYALVLANDLTVAYSVSFHVEHGVLSPSAYEDGTGLKPGDQFECAFRLGDQALAVQLIGNLALTPVGNGYGALLDGGNKGANMITFPGREHIVFRTAQQSLNDQPETVEYRCSVMDHYAAGTEVVNQRKTVQFVARGLGEVAWEMPILAPGFYYITVAAYLNDFKFTETSLPFTVDLANYTHPLTRPADFTEFWAKQNALLRNTPMNPVIKLISAPTNPNKAYEIELDMPGGEKMQACMIIHEKSVRAAHIHGTYNPTYQDFLKQVASPDFRPDNVRVQFYVYLPRDGAYTYWKSATDNNMMECQLRYLRAVDFLATRPEVDPRKIIALGGSRSGPLAFIAAALRPGNICATIINVPTSAGMSWRDKPYYGWGCPDWYDPANPETVRRFAEMNAYLDPVNHAQDVRAPFVLAYGTTDPLSHPQGIELMYRLSPSPWKRISRDGTGHLETEGFWQLAREINLYIDSLP